MLGIDFLYGRRSVNLLNCLEIKKDSRKKFNLFPLFLSGIIKKWPTNSLEFDCKLLKID